MADTASHASCEAACLTLLFLLVAVLVAVVLGCVCHELLRGHGRRRFTPQQMQAKDEFLARVRRTVLWTDGTTDGALDREFGVRPPQSSERVGATCGPPENWDMVASSGVSAGMFRLQLRSFSRAVEEMMDWTVHVEVRWHAESGAWTVRLGSFNKSMAAADSGGSYSMGHVAIVASRMDNGRLQLLEFTCTQRYAATGIERLHRLCLQRGRPEDGSLDVRGLWVVVSEGSCNYGTHRGCATFVAMQSSSV
jgi:hypothetical protein